MEIRPYKDDAPGCRVRREAGKDGGGRGTRARNARPYMGCAVLPGAAGGRGNAGGYGNPPLQGRCAGPPRAAGGRGNAGGYGIRPYKDDAPGRRVRREDGKSRGMGGGRGRAMRAPTWAVRVCRVRRGRGKRRGKRAGGPRPCEGNRNPLRRGRVSRPCPPSLVPGGPGNAGGYGIRPYIIIKWALRATFTILKAGRPGCNRIVVEFPWAGGYDGIT